MERAFTLIEVLMVVALVGVLGSVVVTPFHAVTRVREPSVARHVFIEAVWEASQHARAGTYGTDWGVRVATGSVTVFSGVTYALRTPAYDEIYDLPRTVQHTGIDELVFSAMTGSVVSAGTTRFENEYASTGVAVSTEGVVTYIP
jgi:prepilin-type N-terminal cleavage/methylation domain-containing protein